jgi:hypothetical protein
LEVSIAGKNFVFGSIYGPNNTNLQFFQNIERDILSFNNENIILGGDWNCTVSVENVLTNPDCLNMTALPNRTHSLKVHELCEQLQLFDPFRTLNPNAKDFTYTPRAPGALNRSRIDFFLVSQTLSSINMNCSIAPGLQNKLFDHKACLLDFKKYEKKISSKKEIKTAILKDDITDYIVFSTCAEAYLTHAAGDALPVNLRREELRKVGVLKAILKEAGPPIPPSTELFNDLGVQFNTNRTEMMRRVELCKDDIDLPWLETLPLDPDPDIFFETMMGMIKNELLSYQAYANKLKKSQINSIKSEITSLKSNVINNQAQIFTLEKKLNEIIDSELRNEIESNSRFEILNAEKITPHFVKLMKVGKGKESLEHIKNVDGTDFPDPGARADFITTYYRKLFTRNENVTEINNETIRNFLGGEIADCSVVKNSKLTEVEKNLINGNFSVQELDAAVRDSSSATASGPDGIGNACIKKIWPYIRIPLTNYANCCHTKGVLTDNFRTASIKLIPKKGDKSKIENWRPISLLNCLYKIISKAINNRLKKISNRILSRAQKGFTGGKYIQECLINIIETIKRSNDFNIPMIILAIDQAKAFDSVRHDFMKICLQFFGVPDNFIRMLETFTTNRTASIMLDDGSESERFNLEIGNTQGNGPSPLQFNFCEQILFFKLELDPRMQSLYDAFEAIPAQIHSNPLRNFVDEVRGNFDYESDRETNKLEGFADDGTVMV